MAEHSFYSLSPEFANAFQVIKDAHPIFYEYTTLPDECIMENAIVKVNVPFRTTKIPSQDTWRWNQSKKKEKIYSNLFDANVEISKLLPRRIIKKCAIESFKLWKFEITPRNVFERKYWILWCEKGIVEKDTINISISDYDFLAPFMEDQRLADLFWPNRNLDIMN